MLTVEVLAADVISGVIATSAVTSSPDACSIATSLYAAVIRIVACIGIAIIYSVVWTSLPGGASGLLTGLNFGLILWRVAIVPVVLEAALFVNWHRGLVIGLLLDWLVVCLRGGSVALASGAH